MSELQNLKVNFLIFQYLPGCEYLRWLFDRHAQIHTKAFGFGGWRMHAYAETMCCRYCKKSGGTPPEKLLREIFRVCMVWNDIVLFSGSPPDRLLSLRSLQLWQCTKKNHDFFFKIKIVWKWNLHTYYIIMIIIIGLQKKRKKFQTQIWCWNGRSTCTGTIKIANFGRESQGSHWIIAFGETYSAWRNMNPPDANLGIDPVKAFPWRSLRIHRWEEVESLGSSSIYSCQIRTLLGNLKCN